MEQILRREGYMYTNIIEENLTFGAAVEKCTKEGKKVTRAIWKGYWVTIESNGFSQPVITAVKKNNEGIVPAQPYQEDMLASDWMVVE